MAAIFIDWSDTKGNPSILRDSILWAALELRGMGDHLAHTSTGVLGRTITV